MWWDNYGGPASKQPSKASLVLKVSPKLKEDFVELAARLKQPRNNKAFEMLVTGELARRGKSLQDREFAKPSRRG
jgi:hypothetical protein